MILGAGRVGRTVAKLLNDHVKTIDTILVADITMPTGLPPGVQGIQEDLTDIHMVETLISQADIVVCCLPVSVMKFTIPGKLCAQQGVHYVDVTEDVFLSDEHYKQHDLAVTNKCYLVPQCGLAPGLINIMGGEIFHRFDHCLDLQLSVGALPRIPTNSLGYAFTWSAEGLINEYINPCYAIANGVVQSLQPLEGLETFTIEGTVLEAFNTSGGLGSMPETLKPLNMSYKTMRYPGHCEKMKFLLNDLRLRSNPKLAQDILTNAVPHTDDDVVYMRVSGTGMKNGQLNQETWTRAIGPAKGFTGLQLTTGFGAAVIVEMLANNIVFAARRPDGGIMVTQEHGVINLEKMITLKMLQRTDLNRALKLF